MKVELIVADDHELRAHIKELIRGEVVSIARSEIRGIIAGVVGDQVATPGKIEALIKDVIAQDVKSALHRTGYDFGSSNLIQQYAKDEVNRQITEWLKLSASGYQKALG